MCSLLLLVAGLAAAAPATSSDVPSPVSSEPRVDTPRHRRPPVDRAQTDFTAYTLEWGEVRVGLGGVGVGVFPRTQVSTLPVLDALGLPNVSAKMNAVRAGGFDLALAGTWGGLLDETMEGTYLSVNAAASLRVAKPWSVHVGGGWARVTAGGTPRLDALALLMGGSGGGVPPRAALSALEEQLSFDLSLSGVTARVATDVRFNRRDSLVLQAHAVLWSSVDVPPLVERLVEDRTGFVPVTDMYTASLAWQLSWRNVDARVGLGVSSIPGAWLLNTVDLAWRFGGPTRAAER
ncbi:MAG: hypothetical protein ACK4YP_19050 [Myxococcota bacterium]